MDEKHEPCCPPARALVDLLELRVVHSDRPCLCDGLGLGQGQTQLLPPDRGQLLIGDLTREGRRRITATDADHVDAGGYRPYGLQHNFVPRGIRRSFLVVVEDDAR